MRTVFNSGGWRWFTGLPRFDAATNTFTIDSYIGWPTGGTTTEVVTDVRSFDLGQLSDGVTYTLRVAAMYGGVFTMNFATATNAPVTP